MTTEWKRSKSEYTVEQPDEYIIKAIKRVNPIAKNKHYDRRGFICRRRNRPAIFHIPWGMNIAAAALCMIYELYNEQLLNSKEKI